MCGKYPLHEHGRACELPHDIAIGMDFATGDDFDKNFEEFERLFA